MPKAFKGRRQVGLRIPDNAIARALAEELGHPLLTTSIPTVGLSEDEIIFPDEILLRYENGNNIALMINGGNGGSEQSTIVDLTDSSSPNILRKGAGSLEL